MKSLIERESLMLNISNRLKIFVDKIESKSFGIDKEYQTWLKEIQPLLSQIDKDAINIVNALRTELIAKFSEKRLKPKESIFILSSSMHSLSNYLSQLLVPIQESKNQINTLLIKVLIVMERKDLLPKINDKNKFTSVVNEIWNKMLFTAEFNNAVDNFKSMATLNDMRVLIAEMIQIDGNVITVINTP